LRVAVASASSISMVEDLGRPIVIGYLGFAVPILSGGGVGPPFPTYAILEDLAMWLNDLPSSAPKRARAERLGMSGASEKRIGILYKREGDHEQETKAYVSACEYYRRALAADPVNHWVMAQYLSMRAVLAGTEGQKALAREFGQWWSTVRQIVLWELSSASGESKAWGHGTLAEIEMLSVIYKEGMLD